MGWHRPSPRVEWLLFWLTLVLGLLGPALFAYILWVEYGHG